MLTKTIIVIGNVVAFTVAAGAADKRPESAPLNGFVPNETVAISIAVAVWTPIYGLDAIAKQKPYTAALAREIWIVEESPPSGMLGGAARAEIAKKDGRILSITHGR